jgi:hypothetical protein
VDLSESNVNSYLKIYQQFWDHIRETNTYRTWLPADDFDSLECKSIIQQYNNDYTVNSGSNASIHLQNIAFCYQQSVKLYLFHRIWPIYTDGKWHGGESNFGTLPPDMKDFDGLEHIHVSKLRRTNKEYSMFQRLSLNEMRVNPIHKLSQYEFLRLYKDAKGAALPKYSKAYLTSLLIQRFKEHFNL